MALNFQQVFEKIRQIGLGARPQETQDTPRRGRVPCWMTGQTRLLN